MTTTQPGQEMAIDAEAQIDEIESAGPTWFQVIWSSKKALHSAVITCERSSEDAAWALVVEVDNVIVKLFAERRDPTRVGPYSNCRWKANYF